MAGFLDLISTSSFLPQDKVSEFAQMSSQQLLRETQRAAGDENLTSWHDTLISSGKDLKQLLEVNHPHLSSRVAPYSHNTQLMVKEREQLKTMQDRNADLEGQVQRYKDRRKIEHAVRSAPFLSTRQTRSVDM